MNPTATSQNNPTFQPPTGDITVPQSQQLQVDSQLNESQAAVLENLENRSPEVIKTEQRIGAEISSEVGDFMPPEIPDFSEMFQNLRQKYGMDQLDKSLADIQNQYRQTAAMGRERSNVAMGGQVGMDVIGGRVGEIERQTNERLDTLGRQISYIEDMHTAALTTVQMIMQFEQVDYQNAWESYKTSFDARMAQFELKKKLAGEEWDRAFREKEFLKETALANLTILADMAKEGNWNYSSLGAEQRAEIGKLEVMAGLPVGFLSNIKLDPKQAILNTSEWTDMNGNTYLLVSKIGADGNIKIDKQLIGRSSVPSSGGGTRSTGTATERASDKDANFVQQASIKGNNPERQATIAAVQRYDIDGAGKQVKITEEDMFNAVSYLAQTQGISDEAAYSAVQEIIRSHHYQYVNKSLSGSGSNRSAGRTA